MNGLLYGQVAARLRKYVAKLYIIRCNKKFNADGIASNVVCLRQWSAVCSPMALHTAAPGVGGDLGP